MAELFADLIGQPQAVKLLTAALLRQRLAPAYLFVGPDGVGRRLAALRLLEGVLAGGIAGSVPLRRRLEQGNHPDLLWVEPTYSHQGRLVKASEAEEQGVSRRSPPQLRLEQVREVTRFLSRRPVEGDRSLVVLEAAEAMAEAAANALLKTLEEPGHGLLVLLTAAPERLLTTIRSRCQPIPFQRLSPALVQDVLQRLPPDGEAPSSDPPELLDLAAGSPGALLRHRRFWRALPEGLTERLLALGREPMEALALARDLCESLDGEQQLWLLDWWQWQLWRRCREPGPLRRIEQLRSQLLAYVQPRLAWEVALLELGA
ncbi:DNA polymerase III subunit delta' [Synechococcus sp. CCY 9618]|uniref:DNA polymerase III subunit delta' n=1 Tax=Synechococcus sp. CCY 9618 TaxID=2815602 RepID=UPI001C238DC6|nr:DNA polymerase III subunit delta' [Synechococcus sp. CCY 9618]